MFCSKKKALKAAQAAEKAAEQAARKAQEQGNRALDGVSDAFGDVMDYVTPRAQQAAEKVADTVGPFAADAARKVQPAVENAYGAVSEKVQHDLYPKLAELWNEANKDPRVHEVAKRGASTLAALRGDISVPAPAPVKKKPGFVARFFTVLGIAAVAGAVIVVVRAILGSSDDGWSPQQPMRPAREESDADWGENPFDKKDAPARSADEEADSKDAERAAEYGEGAYVGQEPPEDFNIKGNERSMKYHVPEAAGYDRTNADVWFNSEEAAQAAGFTRALR